MSHITGSVQVLGAPLVIGPGDTVFNPPQSPEPGGTKLLMLHFQNLNFKPGDQLQVNLGYATDTFTAADGPDFWTRPVNVYIFPAGVQISYVPGGADHSGSVQLDQFGRGERHVGQPGHPSISNCDPFYTGTYQEPTYDPFWYCSNPPNWENEAAVTDPTDVRARVARSVGMIFSVEAPDLSTCSVTLVDTDKVITAGHCHTPQQALTSSVVFDYQTLADGSRPPGYNPKFYKVKAVLAHHNDGIGDFSLLQFAEAPAGIPPIQMRPTLPLVGEQVFGVHHPNGAVKKLSLPHSEGFATVSGSSSAAINVPIPSDFHVSGGSSGSGLFDAAGRIVGILSNGAPCSGSPLNYFPIATVLTAIIPTPPPPITRDVMVVIDRSGSMSSDDGTGRPKIEAARDAVSLFVQLVRAGTGNRVGLVSFSTAAATPFAITPVTGASKNTLIGPPPFSSGIVGGLTPSGNTTIGGGLEAARLQFPFPGANPRSILLLTDGLENTAPMVADVEPALSGININAIGLGSDSNLNGLLLSNLATSHGGLYQQTPGGITLEKFFSAAFGNIFETGILMDPEFDLPANQDGDPLPFRVCGEETITAVVGWDRTDTTLIIEVTTPAGASIVAPMPAVESATGRTWSFLRIKLPFGSERDGLWKVRVLRPRGSGEFPPPTPALRYFVNVIPSGGPKFLRRPDSNHYYTGDAFNPMLWIRHDDGGWPENIAINMTVSRPDAGVGNILAASGLGCSRLHRCGRDSRPPGHSTSHRGVHRETRGQVRGHLVRHGRRFRQHARPVRIRRHLRQGVDRLLHHGRHLHVLRQGHLRRGLPRHARNEMVGACRCRHRPRQDRRHLNASAAAARWRPVLSPDLQARRQVWEPVGTRTRRRIHHRRPTRKHSIGDGSGSGQRLLSMRCLHGSEYHRSAPDRRCAARPRSRDPGAANPPAHLQREVRLWRAEG